MNRTRVLVVDDDEMFIEMVEMVLSTAGFTVQTATNAHQALERTASFRPDLILMDIQMPGTDGKTLTRRLKSDPLTRQIVVVAFTAFANKGDELGLKAAGFDGYIAKPVDALTLTAQVGFWLDGPSSARASPFVWP